MSLTNYVIPSPPCPRGHYGHQCTKTRGHTGGHLCGCGVVFSTFPSQHVPPHDPFHWPESNAA